MGHSWPSASLETIADVIDSRHKTPSYSDFGYPMVRVVDVKGGALNLSETKRVTKDVYADFSKGRDPKVGDLVISRVGSYGIVSYVANEDKFCLGQNTALIIPKINSRFLYYQLVSPLIQSQIDQMVVGAVQKTISLKAIKQLNVNLPPINEQKSIAHILGTLDDKIELNRQMNQTLEAMAQALFKSWFVDFDPVIDNALSAGNPIPEALQKRAEARKALGDKRKPLPEGVQSQFPDCFVFNEEMGWVPEGWEVGAIKHLCKNVESGGTPSRKEPSYWDNGIIPWLTSGEVNQDIIIGTKSFITSRGLEDSSAKIWPKMSTIVAMYGATAGKVTLLACETSANQACCALIPKENSKSFVYYKAKDSVSKYESRARGSAQQNLNKSIVSDLESLIPSTDILENFEKEITPILLKIIFAKTTNIQIVKVRDTLLPKLMSGELRVPDAEKLLEKNSV